VPELDGRVEGVDMSHEAAVGKIARDEVEYLMARGLTEEQSVSTIVRGFMNVDIEGLPPELKAQIDRAIELSEQSLM
jgi:Fe-S cluster assembly scaffold protein SufB